MRSILLLHSGSRVVLMGVILLLNSTAMALDTEQSQPSIVNKEVLPQHKEEVSAIYRECLMEQHGLMVECIQKRVADLGEEVDIFEYQIQMDGPMAWEAPQEYIDRENPIAIEDVDLKSGAKLFKFHCSGCHGMDGRGFSPQAIAERESANLGDSSLQDRTDGELFWRITDGGWPMPAFWEGDILSENDIWSLIHFIRHISYVDINLQQLSGIKNVMLIDKDIVAGGPPSADDIIAAKNMGILSIVDLRVAEKTATEKSLVEAQGMNYYNIPVTADTLSLDDVKAVSEILNDMSNRPLILHCGSGNRVGGLWALYSHLHRDMSKEAAYAEGLDKGLSSVGMKFATDKLLYEIE